MILVTIGTHSQGFERLVHAVDKFASEVDEEIVVQVGDTPCKPKCAAWFSYVSDKDFDVLYRKARVVISHAGAGSMITALKYNKPLIVVPRQKQFGEHVDNHQEELATALEQSGLVTAVWDVGGLKDALRKCRKPIGAGRRKQQLITTLRSVLEEMQ